MKEISGWTSRTTSHISTRSKLELGTVKYIQLSVKSKTECHYIKAKMLRSQRSWVRSFW